MDIVSQRAASVVSYETWIAALASSACIGFTSLVPWLFNMTFFEQQKPKSQKGNRNIEDVRMKYLLSFAVGSILGDIFFHLIPESFQGHLTEFKDSKEVARKKVGLSILAGIFMFIIVEMILEKWSATIKDENNDEQVIKGKTTTKTTKQLQRKQQSSIPKDKLPLNKNEDLKQAIGSLVNYGNIQRQTFENNNINNNNNNNSITDLNTCRLNRSTDLTFEPDLTKDGYNEHITMKGQSLNIRRNCKKGPVIKINGNSSAISDCLNANSSNIDAKLCRTCHNSDESVGKKISSGCRIVDVAGYLSLIANGFDNFTHGLAIGASFLVGPKVGLLTTFVVFIHEIPHEICDYAILVNSGFSRWDALKAQSSVSLFGILGTALALYVKSVQTLTAKTVWILPFSAGGFLYIALVNLLPEILERKTNVHHSLRQTACVILGIAFTAAVAII